MSGDVRPLFHACNGGMRVPSACNGITPILRTEPTLWTWPDLVRLLPDWTDEDRAVLARVAEAWKVAPPPWP